MILDSFENIRQHISFSSYLEKVIFMIEAIDRGDFDFYYNKNTEDQLKVIRIEKVYDNSQTKMLLERHIKYIDFHYIIEGADKIGILDFGKCSIPAKKYDAYEDYELYNDVPECNYVLKAREFMIITPDHAHSTLNGNGNVNKIVIKIPVDNNGY